MTKQYSLEATSNVLEMGKGGITLHATGSLLAVKDTNGNLKPVQIGTGVNANEAVTKQQLNDATGSSRTVTAIDFPSIKPTVTGFNQNEVKEFPLVQANASVISKYSQNALQSVIEGNLIKPDGLVNNFIFTFYYDQKGGFNDEDISVVFKLVEYNGTSEVNEEWVEHTCGVGNNRTGYINIPFIGIRSDDTDGNNKGWKLKIMSKEADSNFRFSLEKVLRISS